ncbi:MAG: hypothetical protein HQL14_00230 [Candidatus Omnitrophica bacterium]|nr:hypothetical protein [Candidatus Omnitrophota bacterium]
MIENILGAASGLLFPAVLGYSLILLIFKGPLFNSLLTLALGFGLGLGIITQWMLFLLVIHFPLTFWNIYIPLSLILAVLYLFSRHWKQPATLSWKHSEEARNTFLQNLIFLYSAVFVSYQLYFIFYNTLLLPVYTWDGILAIVCKSKYLYYNGQLPGLKLFTGTSYPLHVELSLTWMAITHRAWDDQMIKIIFPVMFVCYLVIHIYFLKYFTNRQWAAVGAALLCSACFLDFHATIEYRAIFLLYYNIVPVLLLIFWHKQRHDGFLLLAGLLAGFSTFTKLEATGHSLIYIILLWILLNNLKLPLREKFQKFIRFFLPMLLIYLFFVTIKRTLHFSFMEGREALLIPVNYFDRLRQMIKGFAYNFYFSTNWNILWFILTVSFIKNGHRIKDCFTTLILTVTLGMYIVLYIGVGLLTQAYAQLFCLENLSRAILHFFPLVPLLIVLTNFDGSKTK